jgi:hypothetical protein
MLRVRRGKTYDLRPLVETLVFDSERAVLRMRLAARQGAFGRPEEVLQALGLDPAQALAVRTELVLLAAGAAPSKGTVPDVDGDSSRSSLKRATPAA